MSMMETLMQAAADSVRSQAEDLRLKDASLKDLREGLSDRTSRKTGSETKPSDRLRYELAQIPGASWPLLCGPDCFFSGRYPCRRPENRRRSRKK